jgi:hypothetical protein
MHLLMVITHGGTRMLSWFRRRRSQSDTPAATETPIPSPVAEPTPVPAAAPSVHIPHDKIEARAYEIWVRKGKPHGQDFQNWAEAEAELRAEFAAQPDPEPLPRKPR